MKKLIIASLLILPLAACNGYENLKTPFNFTDSGINLFGTDSKLTSNGAFEIVVNAPAGTTRATAMELFEAEAKKVCQGKPYKKIIRSEGTAEIRDFGVKGVDTQNTTSTTAPTIKGYVECQ